MAPSPRFLPATVDFESLSVTYWVWVPTVSPGWDGCGVEIWRPEVFVQLFKGSNVIKQYRRDFVIMCTSVFNLRLSEQEKKGTPKGP